LIQEKLVWLPKWQLTMINNHLLTFNETMPIPFYFINDLMHSKP
jgi:hypothetical protein